MYTQFQTILLLQSAPGTRNIAHPILRLILVILWTIKLKIVKYHYTLLPRKTEFCCHIRFMRWKVDFDYPLAVLLPVIMELIVIAKLFEIVYTFTTTCCKNILKVSGPTPSRKPYYGISQFPIFWCIRVSPIQRLSIKFE